jgi:hypothetical protein
MCTAEDDEYTDVINGLCGLITNALHSLEAERHYPKNNADQMDALIDFQGTRVKVLRDLRERFENEMARPMERE